MKTLKINVEGDFEVDDSGNLVTIDGIDKVLQDIKHRLFTLKGEDLNHPEFGNEVGFDGLFGNELDIQVEVVRGEIYRIISEYMEEQRRLATLETYGLSVQSNTSMQYAVMPDDMIVEIIDIDIELVATGYLDIKIQLKLLKGNTIDMKQRIAINGGL